MSPFPKLPCPQCGTDVERSPASKWRPFCSERCKMLDFGAWASERYRIPVAERDESSDDPSPPGEPDSGRAT